MFVRNKMASEEKSATIQCMKALRGTTNTLINCRKGNRLNGAVVSPNKMNKYQSFVLSIGEC